MQVMIPPNGAVEVVAQRHPLDSVVDSFGERAYNHRKSDSAERDALRQRVRQRSADLLDEWCRVVQDQRQVGASLKYNQYEGGTGVALLHDFLDPGLRNLPSGHWRMKFRANRSMRDVEANVNIWVRSLENVPVDEEE